MKIEIQTPWENSDPLGAIVLATKFSSLLLSQDKNKLENGEAQNMLCGK
jgi:hypothetical protein